MFEVHGGSLLAVETDADISSYNVAFLSWSLCVLELLQFHFTLTSLTLLYFLACSMVLVLVPHKLFGVKDFLVLEELFHFIVTNGLISYNFIGQCVTGFGHKRIPCF